MGDRKIFGWLRALCRWFTKGGTQYDGEKQAQAIARLTEKLTTERVKVERLESREARAGRNVPTTRRGDRTDEPDATAARLEIKVGEGWSAFAFDASTAGVGDRTDEPDAETALRALRPVVVTLPDLPGALPFTEKLLVRSLTPEMQWKAIDHYRRLKARGIRLQFNSGTRTPEEQAAIRARTESAAASGADPGGGLSGFAAKRSFHEIGLAYDGEPDPKNDHTWLTFGLEAEALGLEWGGRWSKTVAGKTRTDRPHVQMRVPETQRQALASAFLLAGVLILGAAAFAKEANGGK